MVAKTGVARLALATGIPVIPVAHWGAQRILPYGNVRAAGAAPQDRAGAGRAAGRPVGVRRPAAQQPGPRGPPPTRSWPTWPACSASCAARSRRPSRTTRPWLAGGSAQDLRALQRSQRRNGSSRRTRSCPREAPTAVKAAVLGAGSWGTTFAQVLCDAGTPDRAVVPPARDRRRHQRQPRRTADYLPGITAARDAARDRRPGAGAGRRGPGRAGRARRRRCGPTWPAGRPAARRARCSSA